MANDLLAQTRAYLTASKGHWTRIIEATGYDRSTLSRIARGKVRNPRYETLRDILDYAKQNRAA